MPQKLGSHALRHACDYSVCLRPLSGLVCPDTPGQTTGPGASGAHGSPKRSLQAVAQLTSVHTAPTIPLSAPHASRAPQPLCSCGVNASHLAKILHYTPAASHGSHGSHMAPTRQQARPRCYPWLPSTPGPSQRQPHWPHHTPGTSPTSRHAAPGGGRCGTCRVPGEGAGSGWPPPTSAGRWRADLLGPLHLACLQSQRRRGPGAASPCPSLHHPSASSCPPLGLQTRCVLASLSACASTSSTRTALPCRWSPLDRRAYDAGGRGHLLMSHSAEPNGHDCAQPQP